MVWAKLDDEILDNEKIAEAGALGFALHIAAITWCCRNLTDGFVPRTRVTCLLDLSGVMWSPKNPGGVGGHEPTAGGQDGADALAIAEHLVTVGLWIWDDERRGYWLHDFLEYNPSKESVLAERKRGRERAKASHETRTKSNPPPAEASTGLRPKIREQSSCTSPGPVPVPVPVPVPSPPSGEISRARDGVVRIDLPLEDDARGVFAARTMTREAGKPIADVWALFCGHYAGQDFRSRENLIGRWQKWVVDQCGIADKERNRERDRRDAMDRDRAKQRDAAAAPQPYHKTFKPPDEERASPDEAAEAMKQITQGLFGMGKTGS